MQDFFTKYPTVKINLKEFYEFFRKDDFFATVAEKPYNLRMTLDGVIL